MKVLYYDCFSGISGDMNIGALLDLGVDKNYLIKELSKLNVNEEFELDIKRAIRKGIEGTKFDVNLKNQVDNSVNGEEAAPEEAHNHMNDNHHQHTHSHGHNHSHSMEHAHHHDHKHSKENVSKEKVSHILSAHLHKGNEEHIHRNLKDIEEIINSSDLQENVKVISMDIFKRVAAAEAKIHGKTIDEVHFHEVGATDSIVDIVGAAICLNYLGVDKVMCSSIELGGGFVRCAHGRFPVPAPATLEILKGIPVKSGAVKVETTTPTGAAILAAVVDEFTDNMKFTIDKIGYGVGNRDTEIPNVLRVVLGTV